VSLVHATTIKLADEGATPSAWRASRWAVRSCASVGVPVATARAWSLPRRQKKGARPAGFHRNRLGDGVALPSARSHMQACAARDRLPRRSHVRAECKADSPPLIATRRSLRRQRHLAFYMGCCAYRGKGRLSRGECARTAKRALRRAPAGACCGRRRRKRGVLRAWGLGRLLVFVQVSSERRANRCGQDCSFAKKQESRPALLLVLRNGRPTLSPADARLRHERRSEPRVARVDRRSVRVV
jgi:hypothetical protein